MKTKGVTKTLKKLKTDNSKSTSRNLSGAVVGSVGSVQFQIVPCFSLDLFSRSISPLQCLVNVNYWVLICCTCHFQRSSLFFVYFSSSVFKCLQCLISAVTQGGEGGYLFQLTCSIVFWGGSDAANKYHWRVWGVFAV